MYVLLLYQNFFPFEGGMVVGQLIFIVAMLSTILFVSANLYLMELTSTGERDEDDAAAESHPWQKFGGLFYKSSRYYLYLHSFFSCALL